MRPNSVLLRLALVACVSISAVEIGAAPVTAPDAVARALALDCNQPSLPVETLRILPAPRVIALSGSVPIVTMSGFSDFLIAMGYPDDALRDPHDGALDMSGHTDSEELAGMVAWYYERDGMRPMLIGHSRGGMLVVRTLHELAGGFTEAVAVYDPVARTSLPRTSITDPYTREQRPVVGLSVSFAAALATGTLPRLLLGQWSMLSRLRNIPDTTDEFTGFTVAWDPIAGNAGSVVAYTAMGTAAVRSVLLPASYSHVGLPRMAHLATDPASRAWIDAYRQDQVRPAWADVVTAEPANLQHAADLWVSIRRHWCREGQRRLAARARA